MAFVSLSFISCEKTSDEGTNSNFVSKSGSVNAISLEQALEWTESWRSLEDKSQYTDELNGWFVPGIDFTQALAQPGAQDIRIYIGLDNNEAKLIVVGVDGDGKDMIDASQGFNIYDFSEPIPPNGDPTSPLF